jgi:subtilisin-like proprotein convertase family protein
MKLKLLPLTAFVVAASSGLVTAATTQSYSKSVGLEIPDGDSNGLASWIAVSGSDLVTSVALTLVTSSGWNGDLYAYLEHNGVISVLLNRAGLTAGDSDGADSTGMNVTFTDAAAVDVHSGLSTTFGTLATGTFQPDGRAADPDEVLDSSPRTLSFTGQVASGNWTLFIADVADGDTATLESWSLSLTTEPAGTSAVPEATTSLGLSERNLLFAGGVIGGTGNGERGGLKDILIVKM